jgi:ATP-dependent Lhr-like helicase
LQRAGRSGHAPGRVSRITLVPTHTLELVEAAAVRDAIMKKKIESRRSLNAPLDVLAQHCVTVALGGGFRPDDLLAEVRETAAYEHLSDENWTWVLDFIRRGGPSLMAYPGFRRVVPDPKGVWRVPDRQVGLQHKLNIGAIVSDASVMVQYGPAPRGAKLGTVEESFVARMKAGDRFWFAGRSLEFVRFAGPDGLCPSRERRRGDAAMARRPDAAVDHARRRHAGRFRAGGTRRVHGAGACGRPPAYRGAAPMVSVADTVDAARGDAQIA